MNSLTILNQIIPDRYAGQVFFRETQMLHVVLQLPNLLLMTRQLPFDANLLPGVALTWHVQKAPKKRAKLTSNGGLEVVLTRSGIDVTKFP